jgi:hypothetical protein
MATNIRAAIKRRRMGGAIEPKDGKAQAEGKES